MTNKPKSIEVLEDIASYCLRLTVEIENGNLDIVPAGLSTILKKLCEEVVIWNKEIHPRWVKGLGCKQLVEDIICPPDFPVGTCSDCRYPKSKCICEK